MFSPQVQSHDSPDGALQHVRLSPPAGAQGACIALPLSGSSVRVRGVGGAVEVVFPKGQGTAALVMHWPQEELRAEETAGKRAERLAAWLADPAQVVCVVEVDKNGSVALRTAKLTQVTSFESVQDPRVQEFLDSLNQRIFQSLLEAAPSSQAEIQAYVEREGAFPPVIRKRTKGPDGSDKILVRLKGAEELGGRIEQGRVLEGMSPPPVVLHLSAETKKGSDQAFYVPPNSVYAIRQGETLRYLRVEDYGATRDLSEAQGRSFAASLSPVQRASLSLGIVVPPQPATAEQAGRTEAAPSPRAAAPASPPKKVSEAKKTTPQRQAASEPSSASAVQNSGVHYEDVDPSMYEEQEVDVDAYERALRADSAQTLEVPEHLRNVPPPTDEDEVAAEPEESFPEEIEVASASRGRNHSPRGAATASKSGAPEEGRVGAEARPGRGNRLRVRSSVPVFRTSSSGGAPQLPADYATNEAFILGVLQVATGQEERDRMGWSTPIELIRRGHTLTGVERPILEDAMSSPEIQRVLPSIQKFQVGNSWYYGCYDGTDLRMANLYGIDVDDFDVLEAVATHLGVDPHASIKGYSEWVKREAARRESESSQRQAEERFEGYPGPSDAHRDGRSSYRSRPRPHG